MSSSFTPERLVRGFELIRGVGDSPLVKYDGTGCIFGFLPSGEVWVDSARLRMASFAGDWWHDAGYEW